jgi:hypothetical protein
MNNIESGSNIIGFPLLKAECNFINLYQAKEETEKLKPF